MANIKIKDHSIWFKDIHDKELVRRLEGLEPEESIYLQVGGVVGEWRRMKPYPDGTMTRGIRPSGEMKEIWNEWFRGRKGERIEVMPAKLVDDYLAAQAALFSEWSSPEDEEAFRDL